MNIEEVNSIAWVKMNVSSGFGDLYMGVYGKFDLIRKVPRQDRIKADKWAREVELSILHSNSETGPRVFYSSTEPTEEEIVMERYTTDLFEYISMYLGNLQAHGNRFGATYQQMRKVTRNSVIKPEIIHACEILIDKLSTMYVENPDVPFCFGDFRLENIVVKTKRGEEPKNLYENTFGQYHIVDMRQIDFDFCAAVQACGLTKKQYEAVLKMCLTMFQLSETYDYWFDSGFMFADYLRANFEDLYNALSCIYVNADNATLTNLTRQTGLPWKTSFEAVINNIHKRLGIAVVKHTTGESKTTDGLRAMSSISLLKDTSIRF